MKKIIITSLFLIILFAFGCSADSKGISGTVVDAETGKLIEGAVVLVEWTKKVGIGDYHTEPVKVVEVITDKEGKFKVIGVLDPSVEPPHLTIYKKGYVAWNNKAIFPDMKEREDFRWTNGYVFKMEPFKKTYSYDEHYYFISSAARPESASEKKHLFIKAYDDGEREEAIKERQKKQTGESHK